MSETDGLYEQFEQLFGAGTEPIRLFFAPGRVNLIGEHTDYTGGYVFPAALTFGTWAAARRRPDSVCRLASTGFVRQAECDLTELIYKPEDDWANYPKGMIREFQTKGIQVPGFDILFHGNIPNGAGLSSSASIELVTAVALNALTGAGMPMIWLVQAAQRAENQFIGVNCGIMDQFASGMGKAGHAMLLKCETLEFQYVPLLLGDYQLVITNTNKRRELADSKYNERRSECEQGFGILQPYLQSATCLGEVSVEHWRQVSDKVESPIIRKRLEHVVTENARVQASMDALQAGDLLAFGQCMMQSHESLRDQYEVTGIELDALFDEARRVDGCIGTRMTGAGFGGCSVSVVHLDAVELFRQQVAQGYTKTTGLTPAFYVCSIGDGAHELTDGGN
ncbi:MAG: galactokinase [Bacilli bacterium]|nr:galactokinase [Bacilli bacterium]